MSKVRIVVVVKCTWLGGRPHIMLALGWRLHLFHSCVIEMVFRLLRRCLMK